MGGELIGASIGGPIDDVAPISDCILGTAIQGMGHTIGQTTTSLSPNPAFATFDAISDAMNYSNNVGRNQQVCIYSTGQTWLGADKRLWLDEDGLHAHPASAAAQAHTTITNIVADSGSRLVERIAWRRAEDQLGEAQAIASQHAAARMGDRVNNQADLSIQKANELYRKFREPLDERQVFPHDLTFDTLPSALEIHGVEARPSQLASPSVPPELTEPADVLFRIHQSMINNVAEIVLTGMRLDDTMVRHFATDMLGRLPEQLQPDQEPFTVVFPQEAVPRVEPITVSFADNGLTVTLRGQEYIANGRVQPGMDVTATYKFEKTPEGYKAVRQGDLQIYGFGQVPGASGRRARRASTRSCNASSASSLPRKSSCRASSSRADGWPRPASSCRGKSSPRTAGWRLVIRGRSRRRATYRVCSFAAKSVLCSSMVIVSGPTPPGTGVMRPATWLTGAKSTSPTSPASVRLIPTSITVAPGLTMSAVTNFARPMATMRMSAWRVIEGRSRLRLWQTVTVASPPGPFCMSIMAIGLPTISLRPTTTTCAPAVGI